MLGCNFLLGYESFQPLYTLHGEFPNFSTFCASNTQMKAKDTRLNEKSLYET